MQPRRAARLSPTNAAYLAGLVDGEGSISLTRLHHGQNRQLALSISSTERAILEWVLNAAREFAYQPACSDFTYSATACN
jgi:hypothetical protein